VQQNPHPEGIWGFQPLGVCKANTLEHILTKTTLQVFYKEPIIEVVNKNPLILCFTKHCETNVNEHVLKGFYKDHHKEF